MVINSPGLYKIEAGLFGDLESEAILLLNGEVVSVIAKPENSRSSGLRVRGAIYSEILLLPARSKISVRVAQHFYGQAFMELRQM